MKTPSFAGFVGHEGVAVWIEPSQQHEDDAPLVLACPDLFDDVPSEPVKRGPGRPPKASDDKPHAIA